MSRLLYLSFLYTLPQKLYHRKCPTWWCTTVKTTPETPASTASAWTCSSVSPRRSALTTSWTSFRTGSTGLRTRKRGSGTGWCCSLWNMYVHVDVRRRVTCGRVWLLHGLLYQLAWHSVPLYFTTALNVQVFAKPCS